MTDISKTVQTGHIPSAHALYGEHMAIPLRLDSVELKPGSPGYVSRILNLLSTGQTNKETFVESLPFSPGDTTAGSENELQSVVLGTRQDVDLPRTIQGSNYYKNIIKHMISGDSPRKLVCELEKYLSDNEENIWENSWVCFPKRTLSEYARHVFHVDLLADKSIGSGLRRTDEMRYHVYAQGRECVRIPVSYLLKLSLADAISSGSHVDHIVESTGRSLLAHFLNDNTSPETFSFYPNLFLRSNGMGRSIACETAKRYFLSQLLVMYANRRFGLISSGQQVMLYFSPHSPVRQKMLNESISDSFYRELFMNPCLSGWDQGQTKYDYMHLCHQVLSRSQINAVVKLKEAGIITNNLVVLPNLSTISLANNGTHLSLGSRKLTALLKDPCSGYGIQDEKYIGDLAIKIVEHFLPLFVGTYSAAPYRLNFWDFHPEKALGFLPHELDYTHLRMIWRRWKNKAKLKIMGQPVTPFGPKWLDVALSRIFCLRGDYVQDFRLIDYLVCLMSTPESPALDGTMGTEERLKEDLANLGVFDRNMSLYLFFKLRQCAKMGFSGFEGRYYSLFPDTVGDMSHAANLQNLITALAFKYILGNYVTHGHIPDDSWVESERRQIFFGTAIGIPTFFVSKNTQNLFLLKLLGKTTGIRSSSRYSGYLRVRILEYQRALVRILKEDAADLIDLMGFGETIRDLECRIEHAEEYSATSRLTRGILGGLKARSPLNLSGDEFNQAAERYYRGSLRTEHIREGFELLKKDSEGLSGGGEVYTGVLKSMFKDMSAFEFFGVVQDEFMGGGSSCETLRKLIHLAILTIRRDIEQSDADI